MEERYLHDLALGRQYLPIFFQFFVLGVQQVYDKSLALLRTVLCMVSPYFLYLIIVYIQLWHKILSILE